MESNKLLIGVQFIGSQGAVTVMELIVLRDITLKQLLDGIKYGIDKKIDSGGVYEVCADIFKECIEDYKPKDGIFSGLTLTSYNNAFFSAEDENNRVVIRSGDLEKKLYEIGFITSTKIVFDITKEYLSYELNTKNIIDAFRPNNKNTVISFPEYNISTRQMYRFDDTPVEIIPPSEPPQKSQQNLFSMMIPSVLMLSSMILVRGLMSGGGAAGWSMVLVSGVMSVVTMITTITNWNNQKKKYVKDLADWREHYQSYIARTIIDIQQRKDFDVKKLCSLYPDVTDILNSGDVNSSVYSISGNIFSRDPADRDFLTIRLGLSGDVDNMFEIKGSERDVVFSASNFTFENDRIKLYIPEDDDYRYIEDKRYFLNNLPNFISKKYKHMTNAPLLFSLKNCGALGIVVDTGENCTNPGSNKTPTDINIDTIINNRDMLIERMIFDLCFYHSPDDLQFVVLFPRTDNPSKIEKLINVYKFLPHFRELFHDRSQFVFNTEGANMVFGNTLNIMGERAGEKSAGSRLPHIVFIVYDEYDIKEHAFAQYLPKIPEEGKLYENSLGITFVFPKFYKEHLPHYCNHVITVYNDYAELVPHEDENKAQKFAFTIKINEGTNDTKNKEDDGGRWRRNLYNSYKILSALCYAKISQNGKVPSNVNIFELFGLKKDCIDIEEFWEGKNGKRQYDVKKSISVPIGRTDSGITYLDLHEKSDGPHMLVAGTTGSGKSETIISYLLGLCLCFRPDEVNLMLVDMKGGGFIKRIGTLPHVVGSVTDVDGDENGTGAEYMLKRFLNALTSEIRRRKILFNAMYVDSINGYIAACRDIEAHINSINNRLQGENKDELTESEKQQLREQAKNDVLAHLILVVDEFTELKRFSTENNDIDFIGEITTIARVGRSLGFHIILISQNIEGAITDDIRVNSKSRLCLKVATRQASKEMIGNDLAASPVMPGNGRGYLLVGTGSKFEYFQSAYSGATVEDNMETPIEIIEASKTGAYTSFYRSEKDNTEFIDQKTELEKQGKLETQLNAIVGAIKTYYDKHSDLYSAPHIVFQKPLPSKMVLKDGAIYDYQDGKFGFMKEV
ncbi:MAG: cell division protein FtsK [Ruminococcus sp.]|nr:cell division protein FtsK [Ruminococcus sp.]